MADRLDAAMSRSEGLEMTPGLLAGRDWAHDAPVYKTGNT